MANQYTQNIHVVYKGKEYNNLHLLWEEHCTCGIKYGTFCQRLKTGECSIEEALNVKNLRYRDKEERTDHLGITYDTLRDMLNTYNIDRLETYKERLKKGWSKEEALTGICKDTCSIDPFGNKYRSVRAMAEQGYGVSFNMYKSRYYSTHSKMAALKLIPLISKTSRVKLPLNFRENFTIMKWQYQGIDNIQYYLCYNNHQEMILSQYEIYQKMEEIVIEEYKTTGTIQTAES
jgi:hypothetical protein